MVCVVCVVLRRGNSDGCDLVSTLCKYDLRKGDMFVLSWARVRRGSLSSELHCFFRSRLIVCSAGSGVNRVQLVLSGFSMRLFCFVQAKTFFMYGCIYFLAALVLVCVDVMVMSYA